jgi:TPR repeat protein
VNGFLNWRIRALFLVLAAFLLVFVYNRSGPDEVAAEFLSETSSESEAVGVNANTRRHTGQQDSGKPTPPYFPGSLTPVAPLAISASAYSLDFDVSITEWMENYKQTVQNATIEDYELKQQQADELDGDAAYWLHLFYLHCENAPRSAWQLDQVLEKAQKRVEHAEGKRADSKLDRVLKTLDRYEQSFKLCSFLGPDFDTRLASLAWLERAADLDHMGAQRLYHYQARDLIAGYDSNLVFQRPDLIPAFKMHARRYARSLLETDHPQGYLLMARMYYVGDVYEQDFSKAFAYAKAAYLVGTAGALGDAQDWLRLIVEKLPPSEVSDAEQMARELLSKD